MKKNSKGMFLSALCAMTLFMGGPVFAQNIPAECFNTTCFESTSLQALCCPYVGDCGDGGNPTTLQCNVCEGNCMACINAGNCGWSETKDGRKIKMDRHPRD